MQSELSPNPSAMYSQEEGNRFPVAVTAEKILITRAIGNSHSFPPLSFSLAEGITPKSDSKQKTSL